MSNNNNNHHHHHFLEPKLNIYINKKKKRNFRKLENWLLITIKFVMSLLHEISYRVFCGSIGSDHFFNSRNFFLYYLLI